MAIFEHLRSLNKVFHYFACKIKQSIELHGYDDFNIEKYFRKQGVEVGENNRIQLRNLGEEAYLIKIGNHCTICADVRLLVHDGAGWVFTKDFPDIQKLDRIHIMDNCFIGIRSTILPNVKIGPNSIVGACSVVTKDVPPGVVVAGNPAKKICSIDVYKEKVLKSWAKQRPPGYLADLEPGVIYPPRFIEKMKRSQRELLKTHLSKLL